MLPKLQLWLPYLSSLLFYYEFTRVTIGLTSVVELVEVGRSGILAESIGCRARPGVHLTYFAREYYSSTVKTLCDSLAPLV